jgi:E3 ubiquitin-protein ligase synoviolin
LVTFLGNGIDFFKLVTYSAFFAVLLKFYGIPIHIVRDLYMTVRSFMKKCRDLIHYQRAAHNLYHLYETPTQEQLDAGDKTCIICREEMNVVLNVAPVEPVRGWFGLFQSGNIHPLTPKKLPCGHVFHFKCLRSWLERQQTCPTW